MKPIPEISKFMTTVPLTIGPHVTLSEAQKLMKEKSVRHLPVLDGGRILGVLSDRDLRTFSGLKTVDFKTETVAQVATMDPFTVAPDAKLDYVCAKMAENKFGCALVEDNKKIVGIFTWVDALRAMNELLVTRLKI